MVSWRIRPGLQLFCLLWVVSVRPCQYLQYNLFYMSSILVLSPCHIREHWADSLRFYISPPELSLMQNYDINVMAAAPQPPPGTERSIRNIFHSPRSAPAVRRREVREGGEAGFERLKCKISQVQEVAAGTQTLNFTKTLKMYTLCKVLGIN